MAYKKRIRKSLSERFWEKVTKDGPLILETRCWKWKASRPDSRYGQIWLKGTNEKAHRASWIVNFGPIPDGLFVLHKCDNPPCVNPSHLFLGTNKENCDDKTRKGRGLRGRKKPTVSTVTKHAIKEAAQAGETYESLAERFNLSLRTIWRHCSGKRYPDANIAEEKK